MNRAHLIAIAAAALVALACSLPDTGDSAADGSADPGNGFAESFPDFDPVEHAGDADAVIDLPEGASAGMVTMTHEGGGHVSVTPLDANNDATGDLLVNTSDPYSGTSAYGLYEVTSGAVRLQVDAEGPWEMTIAPLADAPALPDSGTGDGVFWYSGDAATWAVTHGGESNFSLSAYTAEEYEVPLLVNEIGPYEGDVAVSAGPALVTVGADGGWTIAPK